MWHPTIAARHPLPRPLAENRTPPAGVMFPPACIAMDEAENRLHVQKAILVTLMG